MKVYHMTADGVLVVDYRKLVQSESFQRSLRAAHRIMELQRRLRKGGE